VVQCELVLSLSKDLRPNYFLDFLMRESLHTINKIIPFYIFLSFIFLQPATLHSQQTANSIEILEECGNRIILKFSAGEYVIQPQVINGTFYNKIIIPRCSFTTIPGSPELPVKGALVAIPRYADVEIEIINSEYTEEHGYRIPPVPTPVYETIEGYPVFSHYIIEEDLEAYASEMFPEKPVILGKTGILRGQQVAQIIFYPVQYFPLKETVRIYNNITVELRFSQTKR
jgi:hypothetical protein